MLWYTSSSSHWFLIFPLQFEGYITLQVLHWKLPSVLHQPICVSVCSANGSGWLVVAEPYQCVHLNCSACGNHFSSVVNFIFQLYFMFSALVVLNLSGADLILETIELCVCWCFLNGSKPNYIPNQQGSISLLPGWEQLLGFLGLLVHSAEGSLLLEEPLSHLTLLDWLLNCAHLTNGVYSECVRAGAAGELAQAQHLQLYCPCWWDIVCGIGTGISVSAGH